MSFLIFLHGYHHTELQTSWDFSRYSFRFYVGIPYLLCHVRNKIIIIWTWVKFDHKSIWVRSKTNWALCGSKILQVLAIDYESRELLHAKTTPDFEHYPLWLKNFSFFLKIFHWALLKNTISKKLSYYCIGSCPYFIEKTLIFWEAETSFLIQLK